MNNTTTTIIMIINKKHHKRLNDKPKSLFCALTYFSLEFRPRNFLIADSDGLYQEIRLQSYKSK